MCLEVGFFALASRVLGGFQVGKYGNSLLQPLRRVPVVCCTSHLEQRRVGNGQHVDRPASLERLHKLPCHLDHVWLSRSRASIPPYLQGKAGRG